MERKIKEIELIYAKNSKSFKIPNNAIEYLAINGITKEIELCNYDLYETYNCTYFSISLNGYKLEKKLKEKIWNSHNISSVNITYTDNKEEYFTLPFNWYSCEHHDECLINTYQTNLRTDDNDGVMDTLGIEVKIR